MKRIILPIIALLTVACVKEIPVSVLTEQEITITASHGDDPDTKTQRGSDNTSILWSPGDQISLFYGSGTDGGSCFTAQNTEVAKTANFTGTIGVITGGNDVSLEDTYFWATYPYNPAASCDGASITTVLPSAQIAKADTFADNTFLSIGRSEGLDMGFYNICGGLKISISEDDITSITLQGNNNEVLAGTITVAFDGSGVPVVTNIANGSTAVTVSAPAGESLQKGKAYYIVIVPTNFENGFTLTFRKGYNQAVFNRTASANIRRSRFGALTNPDANLEWAMPALTPYQKWVGNWKLSGKNIEGNAYEEVIQIMVDPDDVDESGAAKETSLIVRGLCSKSQEGAGVPASSNYGDMYLKFDKETESITFVGQNGKNTFTSATQGEGAYMQLISMYVKAGATSYTNVTGGTFMRLTLNSDGVTTKIEVLNRSEGLPYKAFRMRLLNAKGSAYTVGGNAATISLEGLTFTKQ